MHIGGCRSIVILVDCLRKDTRKHGQCQKVRTTETPGQLNLQDERLMAGAFVGYSPDLLFYGNRSRIHGLKLKWS